MNDAPVPVRDPVCGMMVMPSEDEVLHDGRSYAFCSLQCRERFIARPGLYIGARRRPAPKQRGMKLMRQRRIMLSRPLAEEQSASLVAALREMMGVVEVRYGAPRSELVRSASIRIGPWTSTAAGEIEITYDLLEASMVQLERRIAEYGGQFVDGLQHKLCRDFVHYLEEGELQDIEADDTVDACRRPRRRGSSASPLTRAPRATARSSGLWPDAAGDSGAFPSGLDGIQRFKRLTRRK